MCCSPSRHLLTHSESHPIVLRASFITHLRSSDAAPEVLKSAARAQRHQEETQGSDLYDVKVHMRLVKASVRGVEILIQYTSVSTTTPSHSYPITCSSTGVNPMRARWRRTAQEVGGKGRRKRRRRVAVERQKGVGEGADEAVEVEVGVEKAPPPPAAAQVEAVGPIRPRGARERTRGHPPRRRMNPYRRQMCRDWWVRQYTANSETNGTRVRSASTMAGTV